MSAGLVVDFPSGLGFAALVFGASVIGFFRRLDSHLRCQSHRWSAGQDLSSMFNDDKAKILQELASLPRATLLRKAHSGKRFGSSSAVPLERRS